MAHGSPVPIPAKPSPSGGRPDMPVAPPFQAIRAPAKTSSLAMANIVKGAAETFGSAQAPAQHTPGLLWSSGKCPKTRVVDAHGLMGGGHVGVARGGAQPMRSTTWADSTGMRRTSGRSLRTGSPRACRERDCLDNEATVQIFGHMMNEFFRGRNTQVMCDAPQS